MCMQLSPRKLLPQPAVQNSILPAPTATNKLSTQEQQLVASTLDSQAHDSLVSLLATHPGSIFEDNAVIPCVTIFMSSASNVTYDAYHKQQQ